jgi:hypothetical protein
MAMDPRQPVERDPFEVVTEVIPRSELYEDGIEPETFEDTPPGYERRDRAA